MRRELTLGEFYAADPRRAHSSEVGYGSLWREFAPVPTYRVEWVRATGTEAGGEARRRSMGIVGRRRRAAEAPRVVFQQCPGCDYDFVAGTGRGRAAVRLPVAARGAEGQLPGVQLQLRHRRRGGVVWRAAELPVGGRGPAPAGCFRHSGADGLANAVGDYLGTGCGLTPPWCSAAGRGWPGGQESVDGGQYCGWVGEGGDQLGRPRFL